MIKKDTPEWFEFNYKGFLQILPLFEDHIKDKRVLDIGCGEGNSILAMAKTAREVIGLDRWSPSKEAIKIRADLMEKIGLKDYFFSVRHVFIGQEEVPYSELGKFDVVTSFATFEHIKHPRKAIEEIIKLLNPKGKLIVFSSPLYYSRRGHHLHHILNLQGQWEHLRFTRGGLYQQYIDNGGGIKDEAYYWELMGTLNKLTKNQFLALTEPYFKTILLKVPMDETGDFRNYPELQKYPENILMETGIKYIGELR